MGERRGDNSADGWTYVGHEFLACCPNFFGKGGAEHHDLFVVRGGLEIFLNVSMHV